MAGTQKVTHKYVIWYIVQNKIGDRGLNILLSSKIHSQLESLCLCTALVMQLRMESLIMG